MNAAGAYLLDRPRRKEVLVPKIVGYDRAGQPVPQVAGGFDMYVAEAVGPFAPAVGAAFNTFTAKKGVDPLPVPVLLGGKVRPGTRLSLQAYGEYSSLTGAVLTLGFWFGTRALAITGDLSLAGAFTTGTTPAAWPWWMDWDGVVTAAGAAGSVTGQGRVQFGSSLTAVNAATPHPLTLALRTVAIDFSIERAFGVSATWGASSASNQVIVYDCRLLVMN